MGRKRASKTAEVEQVVDTQQQTVRHTVTTSETIESTTLNRSARDRSPVYVYEPDPWELSPKTDYTYSRTATYSLLHMNDSYIPPNMARPHLRDRNIRKPAGDLLGSSSSTSLLTQTTNRGRSSNVDSMVSRQVQTTQPGNSKVASTAAGERKLRDRVGQLWNTSLSTKHSSSVNVDYNKSREYAGESGLSKEKKHHLHGLDISDDESDQDCLSQKSSMFQQSSIATYSTQRHMTSNVFLTVCRWIWSVITSPWHLVCSMFSKANNVNVNNSNNGSSSSSSSAGGGTQGGGGGVWQKTKLAYQHLTSSIVSCWTKLKRLIKFVYIYCPQCIASVMSAIIKLPLLVIGSVVYATLRTVTITVRRITGKILITDSFILSITSCIRSRSAWWALLLWLLLPLLIVVLHYGWWCPSAGLFGWPFVGNAVVSTGGVPPFTSGSGESSDAVIPPASSPLGKPGIELPPACCGGLSLTQQELTQLIDNRLNVLASQRTTNVDAVLLRSDLEDNLLKLRSEFEGWTEKFVADELTRQRETADVLAQQRHNTHQQQHSTLVLSQNSVKDDIEQLKQQIDSLLAKFTLHSEEITSLDGRFTQLDERQPNEGVLTASLQSTLAKFSTDIGQLQTDYNSLLQRTATTSAGCQTKEQLADSIRAGIRSYLTALLVDGDDDASTGDVNIDDSRQELSTWLRSQYMNRDDLEVKLQTLATHISADINSRLEENQSTVLAEAATYTDDAMAAAVAESQKVNKHYVDDTVHTRVAGVHGDSTTVLSTSCTGGGTAVTPEQVLQLIHKELSIYDADKTGKVDFALESAGGSVISTRCSETYQPRTAQLSMFGIPLWYTSNSPRVTIQPSVQPGECWAFAGNTGYLVVQLSARIKPTEVTIEHIPVELAPQQNINSAPKHCSVWGLVDEQDKEGTHLGNVTYMSTDRPLQTFAVNPHGLSFQFVELKIHSNHGNPLFTCLYRFRVHGLLDTGSP